MQVRRGCGNHFATPSLLKIGCKQRGLRCSGWGLVPGDPAGCRLEKVCQAGKIHVDTDRPSLAKVELKAVESQRIHVWIVTREVRSPRFDDLPEFLMMALTEQCRQGRVGIEGRVCILLCRHAPSPLERAGGLSPSSKPSPSLCSSRHSKRSGVGGAHQAEHRPADDGAVW